MMTCTTTKDTPSVQTVRRRRRRRVRSPSDNDNNHNNNIGRNFSRRSAKRRNSSLISTAATTVRTTLILSQFILLLLSSYQQYSIVPINGFVIPSSPSSSFSTLSQPKSQLWVSSIAGDGSERVGNSSNSRRSGNDGRIDASNVRRSKPSSSSKSTRTTAMDKIDEDDEQQQQQRNHHHHHQQMMEYIKTNVICSSSSSSSSSTKSSPIILFDGVCNLCNAGVNMAIDHDPNGTFRFVSLQSDVGQALLREYQQPRPQQQKQQSPRVSFRNDDDITTTSEREDSSLEMTTSIKADIGLFVPSSSSSSSNNNHDNHKAYFGSDAVVRILQQLDPPLVRLVGTLGIWGPKVLRDAIYNIISEHRFVLGKSDGCRIDFDNEYTSRFVSDPPTPPRTESKSESESES